MAQDVVEGTQKVVFTSEEGDCMAVVRADNEGIAFAIGSDGAPASGIKLSHENAEELYAFIGAALYG